jgi:hypothetical protein
MQWSVVNDVYSSPVFLAAVTVVLVAWTLRVGMPAWRAGRRLRAALSEMHGQLVRAGDAVDVARSYAYLNEWFRQDDLIGPAWGQLDRTLVMPDADGKPVRQTAPARDFLNIDLLSYAGADLRAFRAQANTLVGVGLLLTFVGLVIALKAAGGTLAANDPREVQEGLRALLDAAGSKFLFSVVGLFLSLLSAGWLRQIQRSTDAALSSCIEALNKRLPPLSAVEVAVGTQLHLRGAATTQAEALTAAVETLGQRFDEALSRHMAEAIAPLAGAITGMTGHISESNRRALQEMADRFAERLEAVAAKDIREATLGMERVGAHVSALAATLDSVRDRLGSSGEAAARDIANAASDAARRIADAAESARISLEAAGPEWQRASSAAADMLRERLAEAAAEFSSSVKQGGVQMEEGGRKLSERLARAASDAGREIRGAGTALGAAGTAAGTAVSLAAQQSVVQVTAATGSISAQAAEVANAFGGIDVSLRDLASAVDDARSTIASGSTFIERAASQLDTAGQRLGSLPAAALVLDELRASATCLSAVADALENRLVMPGVDERDAPVEAVGPANG